MAKKKPMTKLVRMDEKTLDRLKKHGKFGQTYDDVVNYLIDNIEGK